MLKKLTALTALTLIGTSALFTPTLTAAEIGVNNPIMSSGEYTGAEELGMESRGTGGGCIGPMIEDHTYYNDWTNNDSNNAQGSVTHSDSSNLDASVKTELFRAKGLGWERINYDTDMLYKNGETSTVSVNSSKNNRAKMGTHGTITSIEGSKDRLQMIIR